MREARDAMREMKEAADAHSEPLPQSPPDEDPDLTKLECADLIEGLLMWGKVPVRQVQLVLKSVAGLNDALMHAAVTRGATRNSWSLLGERCQLLSNRTADRLFIALLRLRDSWTCLGTFGRSSNE